MAPCKLGCTSEEYGAEARAVKAFFATRGESVLAGLRRSGTGLLRRWTLSGRRSCTSRYEKVKAAAGLADELVRPVPELRAVIVQAAGHDPASGADRAEEAAVFLLEGGCLAGPERLSTLGVRAVREQTSVGSSLFAQPLMLQAVPLGPPVEVAETAAGAVAVGTDGAPEERVRRALGELERERDGELETALLSDHLALLRRWYYRPEKQRAGEVFLPNADGSWPVRRILRGAARMVIGEPKAMQETDREGAKAIRTEGLKTKVLHEGRPEVERVVPVIETPQTFRSRRRKAVVPGDVV